MSQMMVSIVFSLAALSASAQSGDRVHDGCEVKQLTTGAFVSCVRAEEVTTAEVKNGAKGPLGPQGPQGVTGSRGSPGEGLPDNTISWCHHNYDTDHLDEQLYIPLKEFILGDHQAYPHGFDYRGDCVGGCSCDICRRKNGILSFTEYNDSDFARMIRNRKH